MDAVGWLEPGEQVRQVERWRGDIKGLRRGVRSFGYGGWAGEK